jgi:hypothetical protein
MKLPDDPCNPEPTPRLEREQRLRLFQQLHQSPEHEVMVEDFTYRRASGKMKCFHCRLLYREHPHAEGGGMISQEGYPIDHRLCNGDIVHL